jgi:putative transposase
MRLTVSEKQEIIHMVTRSEIGINRTLREIGINKSTFYNWYHAYSENGIEGLFQPNEHQTDNGTVFHKNRRI